jgi:hypothetical protein
VEGVLGNGCVGTLPGVIAFANRSVVVRLSTPHGMPMSFDRHCHCGQVPIRRGPRHD